MQKGAEPGGLFGQKDLAGLKARALGFHAYDFVTFRLDADRYRNARLRLGPEFLHQVQTRAGLFDENLVGRVFARKSDELVAAQDH